MKFAENTEYKVVITRNAKTQIAQILCYLSFDLKNEQAAKNVKADLEETKQTLSYTAGSLKLCDDPHLRALEYRIIHLKRHKYFMLYKIVDHQARVDAVYHDTQDYEILLKQ